MTVEELIRKLYGMDPKARVYHPGGEYNGDYRLITQVKIMEYGREEAPKGAVILS